MLALDNGVARIYWDPVDLPCPLCNSVDARFVGRRGGDAHRSGAGLATSVVCCLVCGCYYTRPAFIPDKNPYSYESPDDYFRLHDSDAKRANGRRMADFAERILGRKGVVVELGCGRGELLEGFKERGWEVFGIEMTPSFAAVAEARGIFVEVASVEEATLLDVAGKFDVVLCPAILEHLYRPVDVLHR